MPETQVHFARDTGIEDKICNAVLTTLSSLPGNYNPQMETQRLRGPSSAGRDATPAAGHGGGGRRRRAFRLRLRRYGCRRERDERRLVRFDFSTMLLSTWRIFFLDCWCCDGRYLRDSTWLKLRETPLNGTSFWESTLCIVIGEMPLVPFEGRF